MWPARLFQTQEQEQEQQGEWCVRQCMAHGEAVALPPHAMPRPSAAGRLTCQVVARWPRDLVQIVLAAKQVVLQQVAVEPALRGGEVVGRMHGARTRLSSCCLLATRHSPELLARPQRHGCCECVHNARRLAVARVCCCCCCWRYASRRSALLEQRNE